MRWIPLLVALAILPAFEARADCQAGIAVAMRRAAALPPSSGRAALLEQIQRADVAHHEGDAGECTEQLREAVSVLDQIDDARKHPHARRTR